MRIQNEWQHEYLVSPSAYDPTTDRLESTYDQFIQLRDTLIYSGKKYKGKAGCKLIVGTKEETVEVMWKNGLKLNFQHNIDQNTTSVQHAWPYVEYTPLEWDFTQWGFLATHGYDLQKWYQNFWVLSCRILEDWNYRIEYKIQVWRSDAPIPAWTTKIYAFVIRYKYNPNSPLSPWNVSQAPAKDVDPDNQTADRFHVAVRDLEQKAWGASKTFSGSTSWTDPNGSCSVTVTFTLWDLYKKITAVWFNETDLNKNDVLAFHVVDQNLNSLDSYLQDNSNFFSVKYSDFTLYN